MDQALPHPTRSAPPPSSSISDGEGCTDAVLIKRSLEGDSASFERLARRHVRLVLGLLRQSVRDEHAAEDAAQEALWIAYRSLNRLSDPARFAGWLYRIALREAQRARRTERRIEPKVAVKAGRMEDQMARQGAVREAVGELEDPYRIVVTLKYLQGLNAAEIAERIGVPSGTVRAQLSRALPLLREKLRRSL